MLPRSTTLALAILAAIPAIGMAANPAPLAPGQQVRGEITSADAINWSDGSRSELHAITLQDGQGIRFEVDGPLRARLALFRDGELVQASGHADGAASLSTRAPGAGRYVLAVSGADAAAYGPYTLTATAMQVYAGGELVPPASITDFADAPRTIPLRIDSAGFYRIRMASDDFDTVLSLDGNGVALRSDDADGSDSMLTAYLEPGRYELGATGFQDQVDGEYRLSVATYALPAGVLPAADGELLPGAEITALYQGRPVEYRLRLAGRQLVELDMRSSEIDPGLALEGNGVAIEDDDSGERLDARIATVLEAGDYTVRASAFDAGAGVFTLSAKVSDVPADAGGGVLEPGRVRDARLVAGATDRYTFSIQRAGTYLIEMSSDDGVDSHLRLSGAGGPVANDDDGGGGFDARIEEHLEAGDYVLEASSAVGGEGGRYRIGLRRR